MKVGDLFEAKSEPRFIVEVLDYEGDNIFTGKVIEFPDNPTGWFNNRQFVGDIKRYSDYDFVYSISGSRDKKLNQLGL